MSVDRLLFEKLLWDEGYKYICGVDEVGRGCLYGSVCVAAVIFPANKTLEELPKVKDSKKLSPKQREKLYDEILEKALAVHVIFASAQEVDNVNILQATLSCMSKALDKIRPRPDYCLIDGNVMPQTDIPGKTVIKGDDRSLTIAAASIIAKVSRDRQMVACVLANPALAKYGIDKNNGYGSLLHRQALTRYGPSEDHRRSFKWKSVVLEESGKSVVLEESDEPLDP